MPTGTPEASRRGEGGFWTVFGTATMPTGASGASRRGEGGFWTVFGTATLPTATSGASRRGEEPPDQRQTGLCSMQRPVILLSGLPPDLPDGFIRRAFRPSDRPALPTALPARPTNSLTGQPHQQPDRPAQPTNPTSHQHQPASPAIHPGKGPAGRPYR